jgi:post-segregation antitoxin (ccd killing protein)
MVRVQIQLDPAQHRRLKRRAREQGVSVAEVVRRCIDAELQSRDTDVREERRRRALAVLGKYSDPSGEADVGREHDKALAEAYRR